MKYFEEGQTVYHHEYGKGVVTKISNCEYYPITVEFSSCTRTFTADGRQIYDGTITLSQTPIAKVANIPIEEDAPFTFEDKELLKISNCEEYPITVESCTLTFTNED
jgi:hypothetical protein